ncbi:MAG: BTAD domain-containing putative transcriptional regulator, partial [bacterium]
MKIFTLGRFAVEIEGSPLSLGARGGSKPFGLLKALIAFGGEHVPESHLVEALWPDSDGDRAHWAFATNLSRLRKLIGKDAFLLEDNRLSISLAACWVDALELLGALRRIPRISGQGGDFPVFTEVENALNLYWGPFLKGEESPPPVLSFRETLNDLYLKQAEHLGNHFAEAGQFDKVGALYRQALNMNDQAEFLYQGLMRCCQKQGRIAEGVALFHRCQRTLRSQLGIDPSPATNAIHQEILAEQKQKFSLPGQPSLAFLPFKNLTGDTEQEYFGDGLVFDIATDLVKISSLFLINHDASFPYKNASVTTQQVGRELGVDYVLEGSVRKAEDRIRVTAQLIETESGRAVWGERFDCNGDDLFTVQDRITEEIVTAIDV